MPLALAVHLNSILLNSRHDAYPFSHMVNYEPSIQNSCLWSFLEGSNSASTISWRCVVSCGKVHTAREIKDP